MANMFDDALNGIEVPADPPAAKATKARKAATGTVLPTDTEPADDTSAADRIAKIQAQIDAIVDGVYFDLPDEVYHGVPRLSASGLAKIAVSPGTFWAGSWLDPDRAPLDDGSTPAQVIGKAYHCARLEPDAFADRYVRALDKGDMPKGTLFTGTDMSKALGDLDLPKSGSVAEQAKRLADAGYPGTVWHTELAAWEAERGDRVPLPAEVWDDIVVDMQRMASSPIADKFTGGAAEVSIFWTDADGIKMKCRVDYLRPDLWTDLKSYANPNGKNTEQALSDAFRYSRYYMQAVTYREGIEAVRNDGLCIIGEATDDQRALIAAIQIKPSELACHYVFQEKGGIPNLWSRHVQFYEVPFNTKLGHAGADDAAVAAVEEGARKRTKLFMRGLVDVEHAKGQFVLYSQVYEPGQPWQPIEPEGTFSDIDFNGYWLDGVQ
jgi:hypothetical protein